VGSLTVGGFFSMVTDYIIGEIVPPSVIKPSTQGAPGVKQFTNTDLVYLTGFEISYLSPAIKKWGLIATVAATYGTVPEAVKYITSGGQVIGEETIKNDPLPEIPPLEGRVQASYKFFKAKLIPRISVRIANAQNRISQAYGELKTPGFIVGDLSLNYAPCRYATLIAGVDNILNTPYYEHLNRRIVGSTERLYEPGRVFYFTGIIKF
jgi:iron complex outermembrane receptor protein